MQVWFMTVTETTFWDWWSPSTLTLLVYLAKSKSRSRRSEVLTYHVHALHFHKLAARYDQNCDCTWNMVIENEERFIYTPYTCQSWPIWFESFCVPNMLYVRSVCFFGKRPSKNLQGTVASGNEQRRILPRSCGARPIFGEIQTGRNRGFSSWLL